MLNSELKAKLSKVYALVNNGATEGERKAAKAALDRILEKYNLHGIDLESLDMEEYRFKYSSRNEMILLSQIFIVLCEDKSVRGRVSKNLWQAKELVVDLRYMDFITVEASYEYFRRHMKDQWTKTAAPVLARCRKAKTRNKLRKELQDAFLNKYMIASKLVLPEHIITYIPKPSEQQILRTFQNVEGGNYNRQVVGGNLLNQ